MYSPCKLNLNYSSCDSIFTGSHIRVNGPEKTQNQAVPRASGCHESDLFCLRVAGKQDVHMAERMRDGNHKDSPIDGAARCHTCLQASA